MNGTKWLLVLVAVGAVLAICFYPGGPGASARHGDLGALDRVESGAPSGHAKAVHAGDRGRAEEAIRRAGEHGRFLFLCFAKPGAPGTDAARSTLRGFAERHADQVEVLAIDPGDRSEAAVLARYDVARAPLPFVVALGPGGIVTGAFTGSIQPKRLESALVGPGTLACLRALRDGKRVLLCAFGPATPGAAEAVAGVDDFLGVTANALSTVRVELDPADPRETLVLTRLGIPVDLTTPVTAMIDPPATLRGTILGATTRAAIEKLRDTDCSTGCGPAG